MSDDAITLSYTWTEEDWPAYREAYRRARPIICGRAKPTWMQSAAHWIDFLAPAVIAVVALIAFEETWPRQGLHSDYGTIFVLVLAAGLLARFVACRIGQRGFDPLRATFDRAVGMRYDISLSSKGVRWSSEWAEGRRDWRSVQPVAQVWESNLFVLHAEIVLVVSARDCPDGAEMLANRINALLRNV